MLLNMEKEMEIRYKNEEYERNVKVCGAKSKKDKIIFETNNDYKVIASIKENGEIITEKKCNNDFSKILNFFNIIEILLVCAYVIFSIKNTVQNIHIGGNPLVECTEYFYVIAILVIYTVFAILYMRLNGGKEQLKNHAAEHQVLRTYFKSKQMPTYNEVVATSRISKKCGIGKISSMLLCEIVGLVLSYFCGIKISVLVLAILANYIWYLPPFYFLGLPMQYLTTQKPEKRNIMLAMAGLKKTLEID